MATSGGLAKVAAVLERLGPDKGEPLGPDPPWKPRDPLVERLFAKEIYGRVSDRKRKLSEDSDDDVQDLPLVGRELERGSVRHDKACLETCQDLAAAFCELGGQQVVLTEAAVSNVLGLLLTGPQLSLEVASYFLVNSVGPHLKSEHFDQLEEALRRYPSLVEALLIKTATSDPTLAAQMINRMQALIQSQALRRIILLWLAGEQLSSTSLALLQASVDIDPDMFQSSEIAEAVVAAVTRAPVETDSCLKLAKWLAGCLGGLVSNCREESRSLLQQRLRSNKTFLRSKLLKLVEK